MQTLTTVQQLAVGILPIILAITVHEAAHGLVADRLGDHTARSQGRVTLNPFKHIDPIGTVILPIAMYLLSGFLFGWAKPVPVNWRNLKNPRRDTAIVAAAGPFANFLMLLSWPLIYVVGVSLSGDSSWVDQPLYYMMLFGVQINAVLLVLNLLPLLPLDGGRIVSAFMPPKMAYQFSKSERWGFLILIVLLVSGLLSSILTPFVKVLMLLADQLLRLFA